LWLAGCGTATTPDPEPPPGDPQPFGVITFNVLCSFCDNTFDPWDERLAYFSDIFSRYDPDLIGLQELSFASEVDDLRALLPGYRALFYQATESGFVYPDATVFYRTARFERRTSGTYWLSPTPEVPSSTGFADTQLPRLVSWVELVDLQSHRSLFFATTHVDNNAPSQEKSAPLILERTEPHSAKMPAVVVGDFNSTPSTVAYQILTEGDGAHTPFGDTQPLAATWSVEHNQSPEPTYDLGERIDHIFISPEPASWQVERWAVDLYLYGPQDRYPSDHRAMFARMTAPPM